MQECVDLSGPRSTHRELPNVSGAVVRDLRSKGPSPLAAMQSAQPQPQQQAAQPSQLVPQAGWAAGAMYQQQGLPPSSMPGMGFG